MKLQEFVNETLKEIIGGVKDVQEYAKSEGALVNPRYSMEYDQHIEKIKFDVAVTSTEGSAKEAGAGILVAAIGLGAKKKSGVSSSSISRIMFSVPVILPNQE